MAISHRTNRLKLIGTPAVEQLQNGRYQLTVNCTTMNSREDWYSSNKARIFPDFGSLESAEMSIDGLAPRTGEAYTDMRLVSVQSSTQQEQYIVTLVYQTLGDSFVQVKDDNVNYIENGLRRVTRQSIAKAGTDFQKTVGTTSITSQIDTETAVTCVLANYEVNDTDSYREVTEVYIQAGTLSETEDKVGSQLSIVKETFASTPSTPSGYSIANEQESNVDGIPTKQFTFLKNNVQLSQSEDKVGSQLAISQQWFNPSSDKTVSGYSLASQSTSDFEGIKTTEYRFLKEDVQLSQSEDEVGSQNSITEEWFKPSASRKTKTNYSLARKDESNVQGIPTERYTFLKDNVVLSVSEDRVGSQLAITNEVFKPSDDAFGGKNISGVALSGYSEASREKSNFQGIPTLRYRFLKNNVTLSETKDKVGSQLAIVTEVFNGTPSTPSGYELASEQESNVGGIPTRQFRFLKPGTLSSTTSTRNGGKLNIVTIEAFGETPSAPAGYVSIGAQASNIGGIQTNRGTFAKGDGQISVTSRPSTGSLAGTKEVTVVSYGTPVQPSGTLISESESQENGYVRYVRTTLQPNPLTGSITGVKYTYQDVVEVDVPGEVTCTTQASDGPSTSESSVSGTVAIVQVKPRKTKKVTATVTVEVRSSAPAASPVAFDMSNISCSVTSTRETFQYAPGQTIVTDQLGGGNRKEFKEFSQSYALSANTQTYPGCFTVGDRSATGTINYNSAGKYEYIDSTPNSLGIEQPNYGLVMATSQTTTSCKAFGSESKEGYVESGIIKRRSRPILTDAVGTKYFEVITWTVSDT